MKENIVTTWKWRKMSSFFCNNKYLFYLFFISWRRATFYRCHYTWRRLTLTHTHTGCLKLVCVVFYYITLYFISNNFRCFHVCVSKGYTTHMRSLITGTKKFAVVDDFWIHFINYIAIWRIVCSRFMRDVFLFKHV